MPNTTIMLLLLLIFSFAVSTMLNRFSNRWSLFTGVEFLIIGFLLGPHVSGFLSPAKLEAFLPLNTLVLGLVGFLFGLELSKIKLKESHTTQGFFLSLTTGCICAAVLFFLVVILIPSADDTFLTIGIERRLLLGFPVVVTATETHLWIALGFGAMATLISTENLQTNLQWLKGRGPLTKALPQYSLPSEVAGILVFGLSLAAARALESADTLGMTITEWGVAVIALGVFCGILFNLFVGSEQSPLRTYLATVGIVTFGSGLGSSIGISPLFICFICGLTLVVLSPHAEEVHDTLRKVRSPLIILLLLFSGAWLNPQKMQSFHWILPITLVFARFLVLTSVGRLFMDNKLKHAPSPARAFLIQDALVVGIGLDYYLGNRDDGQLLLTAALILYSINSVLGPFLIKKTLADACELGFVRENKNEESPS